MTTAASLGDTVDLAVVGGGIVGLAHALDAHRRGLSVAVVERDARPVGASIRNFGHCCITAQDGEALRYAQAARPIWLKAAADAGFDVQEAGTVVVARAPEELAVLEQFAELRGDDQVRLLTSSQVRDHVPADTRELVGGALLPHDLRVDQRAAVPALTAYLESVGVMFHRATAVGSVEPGLLRTSRGDLRARHVVVGTGHDVDQLFPDLAASAGVRRCSLHMLRVRPATPVRIAPAVFTGSSLLRYAGFAQCPGLPALRDHLARTTPAFAEAGVNLMLTQLPDGDLTVGDTHDYGDVVEPFRAEELDELLLREVGALLDAGPLTVRERWTGVYASAPEPFLIATPAPDVRVVSVTSGIGMTTALGLAPSVLDGLLSSRPH